jgi:L-malate glycosyltransferase
MTSPEPGQPRHLLHVFSTFGTGGPQVRFATLAGALGQRFRHTIVAMDGDYSCASRIDPSVPVELAPMPVVKGAGLSLANLRRFRHTIRAARPDLLLTYNWGAIEWALANRLRPLCRHVHFEDGFGPDEADSRQLARRVWLRRLALSGRSEIVVPSRLLQSIARERWRFSVKRLRYIPNGVDCARFAERIGSRAEFGLPEDGLLVGSVGALRPEKNFARLIRAFARLPAQLDAHLVLVGDGPERSALEATATQLGLSGRVHFAGRRDHPERVLCHLDLFALSSDTEQMPISLIEAMAAGLPVAATDVGDVRAMLSEENRRFVTPVDAEAALATSMARLLEEPETRRRLGKANRVRAQSEYSLDKMVRSYAELFAA